MAKPTNQNSKGFSGQTSFTINISEPLDVTHVFKKVGEVVVNQAPDHDVTPKANALSEALGYNIVKELEGFQIMKAIIDTIPEETPEEIHVKYIRQSSINHSALMLVESLMSKRNIELLAATKAELAQDTPSIPTPVYDYLGKDFVKRLTEIALEYGDLKELFHNRTDAVNEKHEELFERSFDLISELSSRWDTEQSPAPAAVGVRTTRAPA